MWWVAIVLGIIVTLYLKHERFTQRQVHGAYVLSNIQNDIEKNRGRFSDYRPHIDNFAVDEYQAIVDQCGSKYCDKNKIANLLYD